MSQLAALGYQTHRPPTPAYIGIGNPSQTTGCTVTVTCWSQQVPTFPWNLGSMAHTSAPTPSTSAFKRLALSLTSPEPVVVLYLGCRWGIATSRKPDEGINIRWVFCLVSGGLCQCGESVSISPDVATTIGGSVPRGVRVITHNRAGCYSPDSEARGLSQHPIEPKNCPKGEGSDLTGQLVGGQGRWPPAGTHHHIPCLSFLSVK